MTKPRKDANIPKFVGIIIPKIPGMLFRYPALYLKMRGKAEKSGKIFRRELIEQGIDAQTADSLTNHYLESSRIRSYVRTFR